MNISIRSAVAGALSGKTIGRVYFNEAVRMHATKLSGRVLDLAGGRSPSYLPLLPAGIGLVRTDLVASPGVEAVDINAPLPFPAASFDSVLLFNALYALGELASAAVRIKPPFYLFNCIRAYIFPLALIADRLIPASARAAHPTPLGYFVRSVKS